MFDLNTCDEKHSPKGFTEYFGTCIDMYWDEIENESFCNYISEWILLKTSKESKGAQCEGFMQVWFIRLNIESIRENLHKIIGSNRGRNKFGNYAIRQNGMTFEVYQDNVMTADCLSYNSCSSRFPPRFKKLWEFY